MIAHAPSAAVAARRARTPFPAALIAGRTVVAGGSGFLGRALTVRLLEGGAQVAWIGRSPEASHVPDGVESLAWSDEAGWRKRVDDADAVVNLCGASVAGRRWTAEYREELRSSRIEPTERLAAAHPRVLIQGSAVGIYGDRGDEVLEEDSRSGDDFLARLGVDWEASARTASDAGGRVVLLRTGQVLGRGGGMLPALLQPPMLPFSPWRLGLGGPMGDGRAWMPWIHVDDWVDLTLWAMANGEIAGACNATAPEPVRNREFARALGAALGRPAAVPVPTFALRALVGEFADALLASQRVVPRRALRDGFEFAFPTVDRALRDLFPSASAI